MKPDQHFWRGRRVFITGHSGFKGGWLSIWLNQLGAVVHGFSLPPSTNPNLFELSRLVKLLDGATFGDIRNADALAAALQAFKPEIVFHLAAQPLVRYSYYHPVETFTTNVMGSVNLFEAVRRCPGVKVIVNITTDKCYANKNWVWGYRELEPLGGDDPYSSSKACAELISSAYRNSFFAASNVFLATVRAGNVIGGGDWADDRLIPDFIRAYYAGKPLSIRSPDAVRPWQHVLEPLSGYLLLAQKLIEEGAPYADAWNFGPREHDTQSVKWVVETLVGLCPGGQWRQELSPQPYEAHQLKLDSSKAHSLLKWKPRWSLQTALKQTVAWYQAWRRDEDMLQITRNQISLYEEIL